MDRFDEILKQKVEQFEVPYNESHWAEMDAKLNKIKATKIKNTILGVAAAVITLGIASYVIFSSSIPTKNHATPLASSNDINTTETTNNISSEENDLINGPTLEQNNITTSISHQPKEIELNQNTLISAEKLNKETASDITNNNLPLIDINNVKEKTTEIINSNTTNTLTPDFIVYNNQVCVGEEVSFESLETTAQVSYLWNFGDGKTSGKSNPTHIYEESMNFTVTLTIIDKQTGKEYTKIQHDAVQILPEPETTFTYFEEAKKHDDNKLMYPYTIFSIKNDATDETTYKWNFGNNKSSSLKDPKTIFYKADNYIVTLIAENEFGCTKSVQKRVSIKQGVNLYAPNAFTPNQDGTNEKFIPKALIEWDIPFEMIVTNKSGRTVYKTSDKNEPWNGKLNNIGQLLEEDIYLWQVVITDAYSVKHSYQGNIKLIK